MAYSYLGHGLGYAFKVRRHCDVSRSVKQTPLVDYIHRDIKNKTEVSDWNISFKCYHKQYEKTAFQVKSRLKINVEHQNNGH